MDKKKWKAGAAAGIVSLATVQPSLSIECLPERPCEVMMEPGDHAPEPDRVPPVRPIILNVSATTSASFS